MTAELIAYIVAFGGAGGVGTVLGARFAAASHRVDRLLAAHHRAVAVNDAADEPADGEPAGGAL